MKKILMSLILVALAASMVVGATKALFSDQGTVAGNTVATGTLKLKLGKSAGKPFAVTAAYPGYMTKIEYVDIFNAPYPGQPGQLPFEAEMTFVKTGGDDVLWNALEIDLWYVGWDSDCTNGDGGEKAIYSGPISAFTRTVVSDSAYWHQASDPDGGGPDNIAPGITERVCQKLRLPLTAGNEVQGKSVTFDEVVDAVQDND